MIFVAGGTTEGRKVISLLNEMQLPFVYSTKTQIDVAVGAFGEARFGALDETSLEEVLRSKNVKAIIHAAHPFAEILTKTIDAVASKLNIPVLRWERGTTDFSKWENVFLVDDYAQAIQQLKALNVRRLFAVTGVQSIEKTQDFWETKTAFFRILDRPESIAIAQRSTFPSQQLILGYPNRTTAEELELIQELNIDGMLAKDSGLSGALDIKLEACVQENIPMVVIRRPEMPVAFIAFQNEEEFREVVTKQVALWD